MCGDGDVVNIVPTIEDIKDYKALIVPYGYSLPMGSCSQGLVQGYRDAGGTVIEIDENDSKGDILSMLDSMNLEKMVNIGNEKDIGVALYTIKGNEMVLILVNYKYDWNRHL